MTVPGRDPAARLRRSVHDRPGEPEQLPGRLARAAAQELAVDGVGISAITDTFRIPLGGSDPVTMIAEQLQFTTGQGPCLDAVREHRLAWATADDMWQRWPLFAEQLHARTPFQAVMSVPLGGVADRFGAMDIYVIDPSRLHGLGATDIVAVAEQIALMMASPANRHVSPVTGQIEPVWLSEPPAAGRLTVWVAVGILRATLGINDDDSLAVLRARAFQQNATIDEIARQLASGAVTAEDFRSDPDDPEQGR